MQKDRSSLSIFSLFSIFFLDLAGLAIVLVVFSPMIVDSSSQFVSLDTPIKTRNLLLGFLFAAYPITQFFGAPILGDLSDRVGRRPILLISSFISVCAFVVTALAITINSLYLLFVSRMIGGLFAGNLTVAQASVNDVTPEKKRAGMMALFSAIGGLAWIVAPFMGSVLSNPKFASWFSYATPFWAMSILLAINFILLLLVLKESVEKTQQGPLHIFKSFSNLLEVFHIKKVVSPLVQSIVMILGWTMFEGFIAPYLIEHFLFTEMWVGYAFAFYAISWFVGGFCAMWLLKKLTPETIMIIPLFLSAVAVFFIGLGKTEALMWVSTGVANFGMAVSLGCYYGIFAELTPTQKIGKVFGLWNAGFALCSAIGPAFAGFISRFYLPLPFWIGSLLLLLVFITYLTWYFDYKSTKA